MRLGAPEPTLLELFSGSQNKPARAKKSNTTIEEWVLCFNAYIAVVAQKRPERVLDLLAYSSLIVKASRDYEETPWLTISTIGVTQQLSRPSTGEVSSQRFGRYILAAQKQSSNALRAEKSATQNVEAHQSAQMKLQP